MQRRRSAWLLSGVLACTGVLGCAALDAPVLTSLFDEDPEAWKLLPRGERYLRGWNHYEKGVGYAKSSSIRADHRLIASGCERAVEGLRVCAAAAEPGAWRDDLLKLAASWHSLANYARNGRLHRPRRRIEKLEGQAAEYQPAAVHFPDAGTPAARGADERPVPAAGGPVTEVPTGTVFRKRTEVSAGPDGEVTTHILVVLKRGGAMVEAIVPEALWKRAVLGEPVPAPAGGGDDTDGGGEDGGDDDGDDDGSGAKKGKQ
jgi:hypothetical protein